MAQAVLLTECLQNDFIQPLGDGESLPNLLHVGRRESSRLMGEVPAEGPVARLMQWAYTRPQEELLLIHLRDWHRPGDPADEAHFGQFGAHCVAGTKGAEFAFAEPEGAAAKPVIIDSGGMNDFQDTGLAEALAPLGGAAVPVGIAGVWTEAKVFFLAYELCTRYPHFKLAVCSALTASSSRARHFLALEQMERLLGVRVLDSVSEFIEFLGGALIAPAPGAFNLAYPKIEYAGGEPLEAGDEQLLRYLFRDCRSLAARPLSGGFSGNAVVMTESVDQYGRNQVPHVVKIGPRDLIGKERAAFERIEPVLGNNAPRVADFAENAGRGALKYRYASMAGNASTFQRLYQDGLGNEDIADILESVFGDHLGRLYSGALREECDLINYYEFSPRWAFSVEKKVAALVGEEAAKKDTINILGKKVGNVVRFYRDTLARPRNMPSTSFYQSWVHGDLNGANVMVDGKNNVWIIDFFHTHYGHVLRDLIKFENDLLYIWTRLTDEAALREALLFTDALNAVNDLADPLPNPNLNNPDLIRAWETVRMLRSFYPDLLREQADPFQYHVAALRYAVHTLSFDESPPLNKQWALYAACTLAAKVRERLEK